MKICKKTSNNINYHKKEFKKSEFWKWIEININCCGIYIQIIDQCADYT